MDSIGEKLLEAVLLFAEIQTLALLFLLSLLSFEKETFRSGFRLLFLNLLLIMSISNPDLPLGCPTYSFMLSMTGLSLRFHSTRYF
jgi:hypothetical protein